ncbi:serine/threonine-protein kinase [Nucisporomicrobium flavum]|uniref:serine/threonine-protein kinase n=1 Tax=Nucisporomicrobium flavum TaxID=2785915 RepID=UPI0018F6CA58|nr:serine/threonine-protein kinase [Nucisporomicrobium flavum]
MSSPLLPGDPRHLGGYALEARLGQGGMGAVYLGRAPDGRPVAVKVVRLEYAHDPEFRGRFRSEVNRARQVPPFSTAEVLDADPDHEPPYLVVEYVDGPSLAAVVRDRGPLTGSALHGVAVGIATALTAIHGAGVIHRDLKPGNVLLALGGLKVIDFGIARAFEATSHHTVTGQMMGTVAYMAPERFDADSARTTGFAADIFSWGAVVTYAATGRTPFAGDSAPATAMRILTQPPDLTGVPAPLAGLVRQSLEKDPADRPTARELLDRLLASQPPAQEPPVPRLPVSGPPQPWQPPPVTPPRRRGRAASFLGALVLLGALGVGGGLLVANAGSDDPGATAPPASTGPSGGTRPSGSPVPAAARTDPEAVLAGTRRTLLHMAEIDRDLALPATGAARASDGTGEDAQFVLEPYGVDYLIKSVRPDAQGRERCLAVRPDENGPASLVAVECTTSKATIFEIGAAGGKDDKGRPTYVIGNDTYGLVQWDDSRRTVYVQEVGDAEVDLTFSFVDRGPR